MSDGDAQHWISQVSVSSNPSNIGVVFYSSIKRSMSEIISVLVGG